MRFAPLGSRSRVGPLGVSSQACCTELVAHRTTYWVAMPEENLEIVRRIYCRTLKLDPDLLAGLEEFATSDTVFDFTDTYPDGDVVTGLEGSVGSLRTGPGRPCTSIRSDSSRSTGGGCSCSCERPLRPGEAGLRSSAAPPTSAHSATAPLCASRCTPTENGPSKPPVCGSSARRLDPPLASL